MPKDWFQVLMKLDIFPQIYVLKQSLNQSLKSAHQYQMLFQ